MERNKDVVIILKNPGTTCNIGCEYCAEKRKKVVTIEKYITLDDIKKLMNCCDKNSPLTILFHGGEPTILSLEYYEDIINYCRSVHKDVYFGLQTNATLIDKDWIEFINKHKSYMGVSISLDGTNKMNSYRKDKNGNDTFNIVKSNIKLLEEHDISVGMICTLTDRALGEEESLINLLKEFNNIRFVKLNPCFDLWEDGNIPKWGILPSDYSKFVNKFFDLMILNNLFTKINVEPILSIIKNIEGMESTYCNYSINKCNNFISLYPDGIITTCDNYNIQDGKIGNLYKLEDIQQIINLQNDSKLLEDIDILLNECNSCLNKNICQGGCLAIRRRYKKYYKGDKKIYCKSMDEMINHISKTMANIRG